MRSHRFYANIQLTENICIELPAETAHHCAQVLRYKIGDELTVFNGDGFDYLATIVLIDKKRCSIKISERKTNQNESPLAIHLIQGIARGDKMDLIIQKAVELGVTQITPLFTERCNVKLDAKRLEKKLAHWSKTIISACEQSGRAIIPELNAPLNIIELTESETPSYYLEPTSEVSFQDVSISSSIRIFIGPEGGFSERDRNQLSSIKCNSIKIGPRILRTETAGLATIAILQSHYGDC